MGVCDLVEKAIRVELDMSRNGLIPSDIPVEDLKLFATVMFLFCS